MRDLIIRIDWSDPIQIHEAIISSKVSCKGLYYITREYGEKEESLYLGQSSISIKGRLVSHLYWTNHYRGKINVRIGKIIYPRKLTSDILDHAESAIIYEHGNLFFENTCKVKSYSYSDLYRIENTGNIHHLNPIIRMHNQK
ncbi:hypothetical protein [Proteiniclasticum ruminis]|uniref:hypothetical protein n=1 Tax=Proteiniclasticum ruminis TaxID=398199 RepID=UPI0028A77EA0|nr:hypothetical protein [Proteiniclasticum ruminis]